MGVHAPCRAADGGEWLPPLPPGAVAYRIREGEEQLLVLEWPLGSVLPVAGLSPGEAAVLALAAAGLPSAAIAARRERSRRTVENQLASAFGKLGVSGRLELFARLAAPAGGPPP